MGLLESILTIWGTALGMASGWKDLRDYLASRVSLEDVLTDLVDECFQLHIARLQHLCPAGDPQFVRDTFKDEISKQDLRIQTRDELVPALLPIMIEAVNTPGATCPPSEFEPVYTTILEAATREMWKRIGGFGQVTGEVLLGQNETQIEQITSLTTKVDSIANQLEDFAQFAVSIWQQSYDRLTHTAPVAEHRIEDAVYLNPFLLRRAEDFNHNYTLLARLFHSSPEWDSIQRHADNVFIEAGRGTGKSMLLRRLTAQATVAAKRIEDDKATFEETGQSYFGVYVKLTRGYYDQFLSVDTIPSQAASLMAQHEVNIEVFDSFVDTVNWLLKERALHLRPAEVEALLRDLNSLFSKAPRVDSLDDLKSAVTRFEQDEIISYYRDRAFGGAGNYQGSARDTVGFLRQLSNIFHEKLFPAARVRLFLLIDEFETLLEIQQVAINTVIKMRLNDLTLKLAVRTSGRKTSDTFTKNDPIQDPRDYVNVPLDYDISSSAYAELLRGIAAKRLEDANYSITQIDSYLVPVEDEVEPEALNAMLQEMWASGRRKGGEMTSTFRQHYSVAATYRILGNKPKSFSGFEDFQLLSSGIISNFIELCKYSFHFALSDKLPLHDKPGIPVSLQTAAAYNVSKRLFGTIDGNVTNVGVVLSGLLTDLGAVLRNRLLKHNSEPEANRLEVADYNELSTDRYPLLNQVIDEAIVWSVFHEYIPGEGIRPKNAARPPGTQLVINRIYCPALGISPRARWRVVVRLPDLDGLIDSRRRTEVYQRLMRTIGADWVNDAKNESQRDLFTDEEDES